jgi:type III restriction enzyme
MSNPFFDHPILNSPYEYPKRHWELDESGQPTQRIIQSRRSAKFVTPIPKPKKHKKHKKGAQKELVFDEGSGHSTEKQQYDPTSIINEVRGHVDAWRILPNPSPWQVTPETARLLQHWRHHHFGDVRPFFCQVEAVETAIWLTEVAPNTASGKRILDYLAAANKDANPELMRLALKLATGAGKTTVMAMLIAWQGVNAARHPSSKNFSRGFLICAPGLTIKDRLRAVCPTGSEQRDVGEIPRRLRRRFARGVKATCRRCRGPARRTGRPRSGGLRLRSDRASEHALVPHEFFLAGGSAVRRIARGGLPIGFSPAGSVMVR